MQNYHLNKIIKKALMLFVIVYNLSNIVFSQNCKQFKNQISDSLVKRLIIIEERVTLNKANKFLEEEPYTVTNDVSSKSTGGIHDFFSEGPYWWPDSTNTKEPYVRRDGLRNPDRFVKHDNALRNFATIVSTLASAYLISGDEKYAKAANKHLRAWFIDENTKMNPNMLYAQAITGICSGRGIGIIDAVPLIDVSQSVSILEKSSNFKKGDVDKVKEWFSQFLGWLITHQYGIDEMATKNNHSTWFHAQVAAYADLVGNQKVLEKCWEFYKGVLLPIQMSLDGSFNEELKRTMPFSYSNYNLDAMTYLAYYLNKNYYDAFNYQLDDGRSLTQGLNFIKPYIQDIEKWSFKKDISKWDSQPTNHQFMIFYALNQNNKDWFRLWELLRLKSINSRKNSDKNNPLIWINTAGLIKDIKKTNSLKVILKLDDLAAKNGILKCSSTLNYLVSKNIKAGFGIITSRCDSTAARLLSPYINTSNAEGEKLFEIWNHGLEHVRNEFKETDYEYQKKHFEDADYFVKKNLGVQMTSFGAPFNKSDSITNKVISDNPNYKIFMFSSVVPDEDMGILYLKNRVNMETETGTPVFDYFKKNYMEAKEKYTNYIILQGHPNLWTDDKLLEFDKIINFLVSEGCEFLKPIELYNLNK